MWEQLAAECAIAFGAILERPLLHFFQVRR
jgi:hypothetical protein